MASFPDWLRALQALRGDLTDLLVDADILGALRLWHRRGWAPEDAAEALKDQGL